MKKISTFIIFISFANILFANDSWVKAAGGSYSMLDGNTQIQMKSELIRIELFETYYSMDITFQFYNSDKNIVQKVGFPEYAYGTSKTKIRNFKCYVNDNGTKFDKVLENNTIDYITTSWFIRDVEFAGNSYTTTRVKYDADYGAQGSFNSLEYLYGTGSSWKGPIENITIEISNPKDLWISDLDNVSKYL